MHIKGPLNNCLHKLVNFPLRKATIFKFFFFIILTDHSILWRSSLYFQFYKIIHYPIINNNELYMKIITLENNYYYQREEFGLHLAVDRRHISSPIGINLDIEKVWSRINNSPVQNLKLTIQYNTFFWITYALLEI